MTALTALTAVTLGKRGSIHRGARSLELGGLRRWFSCKYLDICCKNRLAAHPNSSAAPPRELIRASLGIDPKSTVLLILPLLVATLSLGTRFFCCVGFAPMNKEPFRFCYVFNSCLRTCYLGYRHFLLMLFN